jgi:hypothetical protein
MTNTEAKLLEALQDLYAVLDKKTSNGLAVNQVLPAEIYDMFCGPALRARIVMTDIAMKDR